MKHAEYIRINATADAAVLFIHGIIGTPNHFLPFLPLVPESISVYNMLLDGHGSGVLDFSDTSMKIWEQQVDNAVETLLKNHTRVYIAAHSMGTLLAIQQACKNQSVAGLFLLAVPIQIHVRLRMVVNTVKVFFNRVNPNDILATATQESCGIVLSKNPFLYLGWIPRYLELFQKIKQTRKLLPLLRTPCTAYQSVQDEMVSTKSIPYLKSFTNLITHELRNSTHFYYGDEDLAVLRQDFCDFLNRSVKKEKG